MTELRLTRVAASGVKQRNIRSAIRDTQNLAAIAHVARVEDTAALTTLLSNPDISQSIYTLKVVLAHYRHFTWLFDVIGVELICKTATLDNVRAARCWTEWALRIWAKLTASYREGAFVPRATGN